MPLLSLFAKTVLRLYSKNRQNHPSVLHTVLSGRLHVWKKPDGFVHLWEGSSRMQTLGACLLALVMRILMNVAPYTGLNKDAMVMLFKP